MEHQKDGARAKDTLEVKASGPVSRPAGELVKYSHILELIVSWLSGGECPIDALRGFVAPHWIDVLEEMETVQHGTYRAIWNHD